MDFIAAHDRMSAKEGVCRRALDELSSARMGRQEQSGEMEPCKLLQMILMAMASKL